MLSQRMIAVHHYNQELGKFACKGYALTKDGLHVKEITHWVEADGQEHWPKGTMFKVDCE